MTNSNIFIMKYIILTSLLEPNPTRDNHQISVESTQFNNIQCTFKASDPRACTNRKQNSGPIPNSTTVIHKYINIFNISSIIFITIRVL